MKRPHWTSPGGRDWQGRMIPCQTASIPVNAGADKESEVEPPMYLDGGMNRDRAGNWGSDITGQGQEMGEVPVTMF